MVIGFVQKIFESICRTLSIKELIHLLVEDLK